MKRVLLVGCGAEIGASLLAMNDPSRDGFSIDTILTRSIEPDAHNPHLKPLDSLYARIVLAQPQMLDEVKVCHERDTLMIRGREIRVYFGESETANVGDLGGPFDVCILATSKKQIGTPALTERFLYSARYVIGVAEAPGIPALYANLIGVARHLLPNPPRAIGNHRIFCLGSCQSNGWHAQLRALLDMASRYQLTFDMRGTEIDIVHPDTPTGRLGTHSVEARSQDPRNNFRPSFSQIEQSMRLLFPQGHHVHTVSLRTLTMPPGYQISRFYFSYAHPEGKRLNRQDILDSFEETAREYPDTLRLAHVPLGSRGFEASESSAIMLAGGHYLRFVHDPFQQGGSSVLCELIAQCYVHNVRGYCRSVLNTIRLLTQDANPLAFFPVEAPATLTAVPSHVISV